MLYTGGQSNSDTCTGNVIKFPYFVVCVGKLLATICFYCGCVEISNNTKTLTPESNWKKTEVNSLMILLQYMRNFKINFICKFVTTLTFNEFLYCYSFAC